MRRREAELRGLKAVHPVAHGGDDIEVVVARLVVFRVGGSCFQNGNSGILHQFPRVGDVLQVLVDARQLHPEQLDPMAESADLDHLFGADEMVLHPLITV